MSPASRSRSGFGSAASTQKWNGEIDEFRLYNRLASRAEIERWSGPDAPDAAAGAYPDRQSGGAPGQECLEALELVEREVRAAEDDAVDATTYYADDDEDGYGDEDTTSAACEVPSQIA